MLRKDILKRPTPPNTAAHQKRAKPSSKRTWYGWLSAGSPTARSSPSIKSPLDPRTLCPPLATPNFPMVDRRSQTSVLTYRHCTRYPALGDPGVSGARGNRRARGYRGGPPRHFSVSRPSTEQEREEDAKRRPPPVLGAQAPIVIDHGPGAMALWVGVIREERLGVVVVLS
ncbi:hypothetical protein D9611_015063 [Ephemerocybe angulata]|uniref:Uncharacterized protein n=1 Tax=Ephemerocybe angulata TaxID=980116 RepID=A0A8H5BS31_9AGAR|nr:hypothetical protein D9611_015063 [Tulosesus angulatus]